MPYLLGIDVSTTAVKAMLVDEAGCVIGLAATPTPLSTPQPLWSEQEPADWWTGACRSIRQVLEQTAIPGAAVAAIGLTGQMHSLTLLDEAGDVLRPAVLWSDQRTGDQCDQIRRLVGRERLIALSGNDALTGFTAPKILWVREHEPALYSRVRHLLLPKDYLRLRLTGDYGTDCAGAAGTLLMDVKRRDWSPELLEALDIPQDWLPKTHEGPEISGVVTAQAARETGLAAGTPVVGGGGDQAAQAVGVGAVSPGIFALTMGTGAVLFAPTETPFIEPEGRLHAFCHAVPNRWHLMGVTLSAGGSLRWYRDLLQAPADYPELLQPAAAIPAGSGGLLFLPYLTGERTPHGDPLARGAFVGLTVHHTQAHLTRALLEGVAFGVRDSLELMRACGVRALSQVRISGGGAKSRLWRQIMADVLQLELHTVNTMEGAAFGAALLAGVGVGVWPDVDAACQATIEITGTVAPDPARAATYEASYALYRKLYPALSDISHELSALELAAGPATEFLAESRLPTTTAVAQPDNPTTRRAAEILAAEAQAVQQLAAQLGPGLEQIIERMLNCRGHILTLGAGTSRAVAQRFAHLLSCSGIPALPLNGADALHGGAGAITAADILYVISKGGQSSEINQIAAIARRLGAGVIAQTEDPHSPLAALSDAVFPVRAAGDVDPYGMIATGSSLVNSAACDILCVMLLERGGYTRDDFAVTHPGGAVGQELSREKTR